MAFFQFFVGVFQDYEKYLVQPAGGPGTFVKNSDGVSAYFNFNKYKEETLQDQKNFFRTFLSNQMFTRLLERKLWAQKNEDVFEITYFDEHIRLKQARNRKTFKLNSSKSLSDSAFLSDKTQNHDSVYECDVLLKITKPISEAVYKQLYFDTELLPFDQPAQGNQSYVHKVFPLLLNSLYL